MKELLLQEIRNVISEATKVNFKGHKFVLKIDVNEDPNKKGIKVQFLPTTFQATNTTQQNEIAIALADKLSSGLQEYGMQVERDRELRDKSIIGFFIGIEYVDKIIKQALGASDNSEV